MRPHPKHGRTWKKNGRPARYAEPSHRDRRAQILREAGLPEGWVRIPSSIPGMVLFSHTP